MGSVCVLGVLSYHKQTRFGICYFGFSCVLIPRVSYPSVLSACLSALSRVER